MPPNPSRSVPQASAVRKNAPVLYKLRMLSRTTTTGRWEPDTTGRDGRKGRIGRKEKMILPVLPFPPVLPSLPNAIASEVDGGVEAHEAWVEYGQRPHECRPVRSELLVERQPGVRVGDVVQVDADRRLRPAKA